MSRPPIEYRPTKRTAKVKPPEPKPNFSVAKAAEIVPVSDQAWALAGFGPGGSTLPPEEQLARIKAQTRERVRKCRARQKARGKSKVKS